MTPLELQKPVVEEKHVEEEKNKKNVSSKTNGNKWLYALYVTILFLVVSMPVTYKFTNTLLKSVCVLASKNGCPTMCGILVHALVFLLLLRLSVNFTSIYEGNSLTKQEKKQARKFARDIYKDQDEKTMDLSLIHI